jgi:hypothetical protein
MMIVYALVDPRTHQTRYIGKSKNGLARPFSHRAYTHNVKLSAWLRDLDSCQTEYTVLILAHASTDEQLTSLEAHWIGLAHRFGWPLTNGNTPRDVLAEPPPTRKWDVKAWRRDPEVKNRLAEARKNRKTKNRE